MDEITVRDFLRQIEGLPPNAKLIFGGGLTFNRIKRWSDDEFIVEFANIEADLSPAFRKRYPQIKVAFCDHNPLSDSVEIVTVPRL